LRIALFAAIQTSFTSTWTRMETCECGPRESRMTPLYKDHCFTFRFAEDRIIPRFHLEGIEAGRRVKIDPSTSERLYLLAKTTVGEGGCVDLMEPIIVRAGEAFIAVQEPPGEQ